MLFNNILMMSPHHNKASIHFTHHLLYIFFFNVFLVDILLRFKQQIFFTNNNRRLLANSYLLPMKWKFNVPLKCFMMMVYFIIVRWFTAVKTVSLRSASQDVNQWSFTRLTLLFFLSDFVFSLCAQHLTIVVQLDALTCPFFFLFLFSFSAGNCTNGKMMMIQWNEWEKEQVIAYYAIDFIYFFLCMEFNGDEGRE